MINSFEFQLKQAVDFLEETGLDYAILGGIAVSLYSEPRMTQDIDLNIALDVKDLDVFLKKSRKYGFRPIPSNINKFVKETAVIPMRFSKGGIAGKFDFIIAQNPIEFAGMKRARFKKILGVRVKIVSAEDLLLHKLLSDRPRDREDARGIIARQGAKLNLKYISGWLKKIDKLSLARPPLLCNLKELLKESRKQDKTT